MTSAPRRARLALIAGGLLTALLGACGSSASDGAGGTSVTTLRLGYLRNLTHAPAIVGVAQGILQSSLGSRVTLQTQTFNAGPDEVTAIFGGALDAAYLGPNSAINAFTKSHGDAIRIVSGATIGGASLVVRSGAGIASAADLKGRHLATPQLGNTQDVALRAWLLAQGLHTDVQGGGDVTISPVDNATALQLFEQGKIDGAWEPEPWASRMVDEANGTTLVDEATLWPQGRFATTELAVSKAFLSAHPDTVRALVAGNQAAVAYLTANPDAARKIAGDTLAHLAGKPLSDRVLADAWAHLTFTIDPLLAQVKKAADDAVKVGTVTSALNLKGIFDGEFVDAALHAAGLPPVDDGGLAAT